MKIILASLFFLSLSTYSSDEDDFKDIFRNQQCLDNEESKLYPECKKIKPKLIAKLREALEDEDLNVNTKISGETALSRMISMNATEVALMLIVHPKTNINEGKRKMSSPLLDASSNNNVIISKALINQVGRININYKSLLGKSVLTENASKCDHNQIIELLIKHPGIDVNIRDANQNHSLKLATLGGCIKNVKSIMSHSQVDLKVAEKIAFDSTLLIDENDQSGFVEKCVMSGIRDTSILADVIGCGISSDVFYKTAVAYNAKIIKIQEWLTEMIRRRLQ